MGYHSANLICKRSAKQLLQSPAIKKLVLGKMLPPTSILVFTALVNRPATQDLFKMQGTADSFPKSGVDTLWWLVMMFVYTT